MKKKKTKKQDFPKMGIQEFCKKAMKEGVMHLFNDDLDDKRHHFVLIYQGVKEK